MQAQILNLITELQKKYHYAYLFISHDIAVIKHISTRIAIMYLGRIVETAPQKKIFLNPITSLYKGIDCLYTQTRPIQQAAAISCKR